MSRPFKQGLDYFPLDVDVDEKIDLIEAKHGIIGFGILIKLFQKIYKEGYFVYWSEESVLLFSKRLNVNINVINDVINDCFRYHLFDECLHKSFSILTSSGIQKRYLEASGRRKAIDLIEKYIIVDINGVKAYINWINDDNNKQSKVKNNKEDIYVDENGEKKKKPKMKRTVVFTPPSIEEVKRFFAENGYKEVIAIKAYNHYAYGNWHDASGKPVLNWKQKMSTNWFKEENQIIKPTVVPHFETGPGR